MAKAATIPVDVRRDRFDPVDELNQLRQQAPVTRMETVPGLAHRPAWLVTGHEEVRAVLGDASRFRTRPPADSDEDAQRLIEEGRQHSQFLETAKARMKPGRPRPPP